MLPRKRCNDHGRGLDDYAAAFGEVIGDDSVCMQSTLMKDNYTLESNLGVLAFCYGFRCSETVSAGCESVLCTNFRG